MRTRGPTATVWLRPPRPTVRLAVPGGAAGSPSVTRLDLPQTRRSRAPPPPGPPLRTPRCRRRTGSPRPRRSAPAVAAPDAAVDLDHRVRRRQERAQALDLRGRGVEERLAAPARVDGHAEHEVHVGGDGGDGLGRRAGVERQAGAAARVAHGGQRVVHVRRRLHVQRDPVRPGVRERLHVALRALDHQVHVDDRAGRVHLLGDRLHDERAHRDRRHEVPVHHVDVDDRARPRPAPSRPARRAARSRPRGSTARRRTNAIRSAPASTRGSGCRRTAPCSTSARSSSARRSSGTRSASSNRCRQFTQR